MPADGPLDGYVTSAEACARLGISDRTLRRRVQAGAIDGEYVARPQGSVLYVKLPPENTAAQTADTADAAGVSESEPEGKDTAAGGTPPIEPLAATTALVETISSLVERNAALSDRVAALEREAGQLQGRAESAEHRAAELQRRLDARRWWKLW
jgi:hypothetical protein